MDPMLHRWAQPRSPRAHLKASSPRQPQGLTLTVEALLQGGASGRGWGPRAKGDLTALLHRPRLEQPLS